MNTFSTSKAKRITKSIYKQIIDEFLEELLTKIHETEQKESAWKIAQLNYINLDFFKIRAARGSSWIPTPERYSNPKCGLINIKNEDQECFRWCMKYHQSSQQKDAQNISMLKKIEDKHDYSDISFLTAHDDVYKFEEQNNSYMFVYELDEDGKDHRENTGF